jgi:predicted RNase H-like HicB family nuclease
MMDQPKYRIEIFWSDEDGGYIANVPDLRYCSALGESYEEALREVLVAMELHLDTLNELERPVPEPTTRRVIGVGASVSDPGATIQIIEEVSAAVEDVGARVGQAVEGVGSGVGQAVDRASEIAGQVADELRELAGAAVEDVGEGPVFATEAP